MEWRWKLMRAIALSRRKTLQSQCCTRYKRKMCLFPRGLSN